MPQLPRFLRTLAALSATAALLAACGSSVKLSDTPVESRTGSATEQPAGSEATTKLIASGSGSSAGPTGSAASSQGTTSGATSSQSNAQSRPQSGPQSGPPSNAQTTVATIQAGGASGSGAGTGAGAAAGSGASGSVTLGARAGSGAAVPATMARVVYFDFDSFVLRDDARPVIEAHARMLMGDRSRRLMIDGHTDERGSREYNLALGQKRAAAVARALVLLGVQESQIEPVSFGEERPAERGAGDAAWAKNRRAELRDRP